jgi:D-alanyl-D-alanine carboxypeptidase (penicillin-binding protein 5/6)
VLLAVLVGAGGAATPFLLSHRAKPHAAAAAPPRVVHAAKRATPAALLVGPPPSAHRPKLHITARAAIVVDAATGRVLWALHPHRRLPIASTTKIMTALLALQSLRPKVVVTVQPSATRIPLVREGLRPHERVRAWKLIDGLLVYSGNDDALALAVASSGNRQAFVERMNDEARKLGLRDSRFSTPSGVIDAGNFSSAWDLAALTRVALRNARFRHIVRTRIARVAWSAPTYEKVYVNKNPLLGSYPGADGVKTGWTTIAGHCLVASATRHGRTIIAVLLHDGNVYADARRLLDLGFATQP